MLRMVKRQPFGRDVADTVHTRVREVAFKPILPTVVWEDHDIEGGLVLVRACDGPSHGSVHVGSHILWVKLARAHPLVRICIVHDTKLCIVAANHSVLMQKGC